MVQLGKEVGNTFFFKLFVGFLASNLQVCLDSCLIDLIYTIRLIQ